MPVPHIYSINIYINCYIFSMFSTPDMSLLWRLKCDCVCVCLYIFGSRELTMCRPNGMDPSKLHTGNNLKVQTAKLREQLRNIAHTTRVKYAAREGAGLQYARNRKRNRWNRHNLKGIDRSRCERYMSNDCAPSMKEREKRIEIEFETH